MRIDLNECTHVIDKKKESSKTYIVHEDKIITSYAYEGYGHELIVGNNDYSALAKKEEYKNSTNYYVKLSKFGANKGNLVNPKDPLFKKSDLTSQLGNNKIYQWHLVDKKIFNAYLNFLITGETKWVRNAQQMIQTKS